MRSTADLIKQLGREAKQFTRVALIIGFEEHTQFLFHREDSALEELNGLIQAGGEPIGIAALTVTKSQSDSGAKNRVQLSTWPLDECYDKSWVQQFLLDLSASIREEFVQRGAKAGGISIVHPFAVADHTFFRPVHFLRRHFDPHHNVELWQKRHLL